MLLKPIAYAVEMALTLDMFTLENMDRADWSLLQNGAVTLFWNEDLYSQAISSLRDLNYNILDFSYENKPKFCVDISKALKWEQQFGYTPWTGNLDALNDGLSGEPSNSSDDTAICVKGFHTLVKDDAQWAQAILDILECRSRDYLLFGQRLVILIQTNDPSYHSEKIGGRNALWNNAEFFNSSRGL